MGFLNKIKDILFEEVEEDTKEMAKVAPRREEPKPIAQKIEPQKATEYGAPVKEVTPVTPKEPVRNVSYDNLNERDLFKSENTFPFQEFDEVEFANTVNRTQKPKSTTNVMEYEKKKKIEKKYDYGRYERVEKTEYVEKKKFRPSPIISPVYGILNEDYRPEDIKDKNEGKDNSLDFNSVRKKAFEVPEKLEEVPKQTYYEETVTVKLKEPEEEKKQKVKTIDELLEDTADNVIDIKDNVKDEYEKIDEELTDLKREEEVPKKEELNEDTLESDLFDLIDSMYDNREEDE